MTTEDLKSMTVEELRQHCLDGGMFYGIGAVDELAHRLEEAQQELGWAIKSDGTCPSCGNPYFVSRSYEKDKDCFDVEIPVLHCGNCGESFCQHDAMLIRDMRRSLEEARQKIVAQQARIDLLKTACSSVYDLVARFECEDVLDEALGRNKPIIDDLSTLAEIAAKAKAEALEEARAGIDTIDDGEQPAYRHCQEFLGEKAAEYRAKAGRKE